jgi:formylglycine-generating enzyme required for sulfatase activity
MQTLQPNTLLQGRRYKIIKTLGQGGFGITYLALQSGLERQVAVKEFFMENCCERDESTSHVTLDTAGMREQASRFREKFLKEARNIARLNHPHIVRVIDVFEENGTAYYVMEYAEGGSLADKVRAEGHLPEAVATRYIKQVAEALDYIHQRKMNHLDVKPGYIVLTENDDAVLSGFELARQHDAVTGEQTCTTSVGFTEGYAPIEQFRQGGVGSFTPETDIYALGATLFKLLTGITPPPASDVLNDGVPVGELEKRGVSPKVIDLITHAMAPKKKDRIHSAAEFLQGLAGGPGEATHLSQHASTRVDETTVEATVVMPADAPAPTPKQKISSKTFTVGGVSFDMMKVEAGTFTMGATSEMKKPYAYEKPAHQVTLTNNYYLGKTEVTQALWKAVMGSNPSYFKGDNRPVEGVSWDDCQEFISKLNAATGKHFRLPTEAEWEFAARGGNNSRHYQYSGSNNINDVAWYDGNSGNTTHDVASKQPNELGIYDMSGNVWEWCNDWYGDYSSSSQTNPTGPNSGSCRVERGGSWHGSAWFCRSSIRYRDTPYFGRDTRGFRLALSE